MRKLDIMPDMGVLQLKREYGYTEIRHLEEGDRKLKKQNNKAEHKI